VSKLGAVNPPSSRARGPGLSGIPVIGDVLAMLRLLRDGHASRGAKLLVVLTLAYVVSPVDAIPDALFPFVAWLDDLGVLITARLLLSKQLALYRYPLFGRPPEPTQPHPQAMAAAPATERPRSHFDPSAGYRVQR